MVTEDSYFRVSVLSHRPLWLATTRCIGLSEASTTLISSVGGPLCLPSTPCGRAFLCISGAVVAVFDSGL
jgi:hypothetical protein